MTADHWAGLGYWLVALVVWPCLSAVLWVKLDAMGADDDTERALLLVAGCFLSPLWPLLVLAPGAWWVTRRLVQRFAGRPA